MHEKGCYINRSLDEEFSMEVWQESSQMIRSGRITVCFPSHGMSGFC